jgi:hypothetical protein
MTTIITNKPTIAEQRGAERIEGKERKEGR